ncbi:MAG: hypothetical protein IKP62_06580 [Salinivirgaceae bacterium]|nr:hypothetical protein [Salinivirgaceae bacterium]
MSGLSKNVECQPTTVRIIGVGGAGINVAKYWRNEEDGKRADKFVAVCDWDANALERSGVTAALQLDECKIWPGIWSGAEAAENNIEAIRKILKAKKVTVEVGLGGKFGTEVAPIVAREAKASGAFTAGVASLPFKMNGSKSLQCGLDGLRELAASCDVMFILNNESMQRYYGKLLVPDAMERINMIMSCATDHFIDYGCMRDKPRYQYSDAKVVGIGNTGADLVDYLRKEKYRKQLLSVCKPNSTKSGKPEDAALLQLVIGNGEKADFDGITKFLDGKESPVFVVANLDGEPSIKSAPFLARLARQMGSIVVGLVILPSVSDGAAKWSKAITGLQNLATSTDAVFAYSCDFLDYSPIPRLGMEVSDVGGFVKYLIKAAKWGKPKTK